MNLNDLDLNRKNVLTKNDYYKRWINNEFGNRLRAWNSWSDLNCSDYEGPVSIRRAISCIFNVQHYVPKEEAFKRISDLNWPLHECRFNESPDDNKLLIQGELMRDVTGLYLLYSTEKLPMRKALECCCMTKQGLTAKIILQHYMDPNSYNDIMGLLDIYDNHVIEFSTFSYDLGNCGSRNTIIWEVRKY